MNRQMVILGNVSEVLELGNTARSSQKGLNKYQSLKLGGGSRPLTTGDIHPSPGLEEERG